MSEYVYAGQTSQTIDIFLQDSSSTTGAGLAGLVYNSAGLVASYRKGATGSRVAITLATQTVGGAYSSGGFVEIDATHMKGVYRLDLPNAAVDTEGFVTLYLYGATNLLPTALRIDCRALPVDMKKIGGDTQSATDLKDFADAGYDPATNKVQGVLLVDTTTDLTNLPTIPANWLTAAGIAADAVTEIQSGLATATNVSDAQTAIITQVDANETKIDAIKAKTDNLPSDPADQSAVEAAITAATSPLATAANLATVAGYLDTEIAAILADTNEMQTDWAAGGRLDLILDARASQVSVDDLPTNAELATALGTADDAVLAAIATVQSDTNDIQTRLPAALESGRIAAALDSAARVKLDGTQPDYAPLLASGYTTPPTTGAIADAVLTESILDHRNVANSLAKYIWQIRQANLTIDGTVSNAITPTTLTFSSNIAATTSAYAHAVLLFVTGPLAGENSPIISYNNTNGVFLLEEALTAAPSSGDEFVVIAGSHVHSVADIQSGLATSAALAAAKTILDKVDTGLVVDGAVYQFTANMLELGPAGGTATVAVLPATGIVADRAGGTTLTPVVGETISQSITLYQTDGTTPVSLAGKTLKIIFETMSGVDVAVVLAANITISGASSNVVTFAYPSAVTVSERTLRFAIRDAAAPLTMYLQGVCSVVAAPKVDA